MQKHPVVEIKDAAGYTFPVATDSACRNRLLHSRPLEGSEYLPRLWGAGIRGYHAIFNVPDEPVAKIIAGYRQMLDDLASEKPKAFISCAPGDVAAPRSLMTSRLRE